jgi:hypothetical protein
VLNRRARVNISSRRTYSVSVFPAMYEASGSVLLQIIWSYC